MIRRCVLILHLQKREGKKAEDYVFLYFHGSEKN